MAGDNQVFNTITFLESDYNKLQDHLFKNSKEQAAYLLCGLSQTNSEVRFLVRKVIPVEEEHIEYNDEDVIRYTYKSYLPVITDALKNDECFLLVHSHTNGFIGFSELDNQEEKKLLKFVYNRLEKGLHGSLVFNDSNTFEGRIYNPLDDKFQKISKIRVVGNIYKHVDSIERQKVDRENLDIFDRNILAFGEELQKLLRKLNIGVVGAGGNGSAVIEQLCRLGVGKITIVDHDIFETTNVTRIHGSYVSDTGSAKVNIMSNMISNIGLDTKVVAINEKLDNEETARKLRDCDIIFSCLDNTHYARAILNSISIFYYIPIIDMGIKFDSRKGYLNDIFGRIDIVTPNSGCLFCRGEIDTNICSAEVMKNADYKKLKREGYAPELENDKVQAIPYNTLIASYAVIEMIQLLTNFKGDSRLHTIYRFNSNITSSAGVDSTKNNDCLCSYGEIIGKGDYKPFLRMNW